MSFLGALRGRGDIRADYLPWDDYWYKALGSEVNSGVRVSRDLVLKIPAVYQAVRLISDAVAGLPLGAFAKVNDLPSEQPLPIWLKRPNPELETRYELVQQLVTALLIDQNSYSIKVFDRRGQLAELWPQSWNNVTVQRETTNLRGPQTGRLRYTISGDEYPAEQVLHIRGFTMPGQPVGLSPVDMCAESFGLALAVEKYAATYFKQGSHGTHILTTAGGDKDQVQALETSLNDRWSGLANAWKLKVLGKAADSKLHNLTIPNDQSQMLETRVHQVIETARIFNIPPHMLYEMTKETTWGSGIEQQGIGFVVYSLRSWMERIEQKLNVVLAPYYVKWNVNGLLRGDAKARYDAYAIGHQEGWLNVDEIRALEELPPLPNGRGQWYVTQP